MYLLITFKHAAAFLVFKVKSILFLEWWATNHLSYTVQNLLSAADKTLMKSINLTTPVWCFNFLLITSLALLQCNTVFWQTNFLRLPLVHAYQLMGPFPCKKTDCETMFCSISQKGLKGKDGSSLYSFLPTNRIQDFTMMHHIVSITFAIANEKKYINIQRKLFQNKKRKSKKIRWVGSG